MSYLRIGYSFEGNRSLPASYTGRLSLQTSRRWRDRVAPTTPSEGTRRYTDRTNAHDRRYRALVTYQPGNRVAYVAAPILIITSGAVGIVTHVEDDWVYAMWARSG